MQKYSSFCEVLSQGNNKNENLSILFLAPKFHLVTMKYSSKIMYSIPDIIFIFCFEFFIFLFHSVLYNCQITVKCSSVK